MYNIRKLTSQLYWIGGNDRRLALFENVYPIPQGASYNAYLSVGEETVHSRRGADAQARRAAAVAHLHRPAAGNGNPVRFCRRVITLVELEDVF